ncbi:MAG: hypothetical protein ACYS9X_21155, partial [Planctomycetota bacterium]
RFQTCAELVEAIDRELAAADAPKEAPAPGARKDTSRRRAFEERASPPAGTTSRAGPTPDTGAPDPPAASAPPDPADAAAALIAHARASAPAGSGGAGARSPGIPAAPAPGSEPTFRGGGPRRHPAAGPRADEPSNGRPTRATIHVPKRRGSQLPMTFLGVVIAGVVLTLVGAVLYLFFTTSG